MYVEVKPEIQMGWTWRRLEEHGRGLPSPYSICMYMQFLFNCRWEKYSQARRGFTGDREGLTPASINVHLKPSFPFNSKGTMQKNV